MNKCTKMRLSNEYVYELPLTVVLLFKNIMPEDQLNGAEKRWPGKY